MRDKYYLTGFTPPAGATSGADVANLQRGLNAMGANLIVDGVYGPKTQAAYIGLSGTSGASGAAGRWADGVYAFMQGIQPLFSSSYVGYTPQSDASIRAQLRDALRPGVDAAIERRRELTEENMAELDTDAWARGMGRSTYVTDMKDRQMDEEAEDIAEMEAAYSAALAQAFMQAQQDERARALQAQLYNAGQQASVNQLAFSTAQDLYGQYAAQAQAAQKASSRSSGGAPATSPDIALLFLSMHTPEERRAIYDGVTQEDREYRDELIASLGKAGYLQAQGLYPG
jgi:peptidoglycan hydrolase-like protein with peptidoglycan-binding domain